MTADEMYAAGAELEASGTVDDLPAVEQWYRQAAAAGSVQAMARLGLLLEGRIRAQMEGRSQYNGNFAEAAYWYQNAADRGDTWAAFALGRLYADKLHNWDAAVPWFRKAAATRQPGHWQAIERLREGPTSVERRRSEDALLDQVKGHYPSPSSGGAAGGNGGCLVVAILVVLPVLFALLATVGRLS